MLMPRVIFNVLRDFIRWQENPLKLKLQRKKKAIYSELEKEKLKRLAILLKSNKSIQCDRRNNEV